MFFPLSSFGRTLSLLVGIFAFLFAATTMAGGTIELHLDGAPLINQEVTDYTDGSSYTTDANGKIEFPYSCPGMEYTDGSGVRYRMLEFCGVSSDLPVYKFGLAKTVTLSGRIEIDDLCKSACNLRFFNLDTGLGLNTGSGLKVNVWHTFSETLSAGRYRIILETSNWPVPGSEYLIDSVGVDARGGSVSDISLKVSRDTQTNRFGSTPPRADLIHVEHTDDSRFSVIKGAPGAVLPIVPVSVLNVQTGQALTGASENDGSFELHFFAPPGSYIQITQDPHAQAYNGFSSSNPSTVIKVPVELSTHTISTAQRLNGSSKTPLARDLKIKGGYDPGVAWFYGEIDSAMWSAGSSGRLSGQVEILSRNLNAETVVELQSGSAYLEQVINQSGQQKAAAPEGSSSDMTVTGLPISRSEPEWAELIDIGQIKLSNYRFIEEGKAIAEWELNYSVPDLTPNGIYQIVLSGQGWSMNPMVKGLQTEQRFYDDVYGEPSFHLSTVHGAAQITIGDYEPPRLYSALLMNELSNGSRGVVANEDRENFGISGRLVTNSSTAIFPPNTESPLNNSYNIEPFIPLTAYSNKEWISNPKIPFKFPSGSLTATVTSPSGKISLIGPYPILGSYLQKASTPLGEEIVRNSNAPDLHYGLTTYRDEFNVSFSEYGDYVVEIKGDINDEAGHRYDIRGHYTITVAETLDFETGVFPGTPFEVGDAYSPAVVIQPGVPAEVVIDIDHYPYPNKSQKVSKRYEDWANRFGYFQSDKDPLRFEEPGEYRVNYELRYLSEDGTLWAGTRQWGSIVETPNSRISAKGARGSESGNERRQWYLFSDTSYERNAHFFSPYQTGDVIWTANFTDWNAALQNVTTIEDAGTQLASVVSNRNNQYHNVNGSVALVSSVEQKAQMVPPFVNPDQPDVQWGYYYSANGRPGVSVREFVGTATSANGYWRFNTPYGYQLGNGYEGDQEDDFKFLFGGAVYRAPDSEFSFYGAYGGLWVMLPEDDEQGGRVMPPFQGAAGGPSGGPLMTIKGEEIDIFAHPMGIRPGTLLEVGDTVSFSAQIAPTLPSEVDVIISTPSGSIRTIKGVANKVGYFYDPLADFIASEAGVYTAEITVTHTGMTSAGMVEAPYPQGSVLGAEEGRFAFYVASPDNAPAVVSSPLPRTLPDDVRLALRLAPSGSSSVSKMHSTVTMPGFLLSQDESPNADFTYDATALHSDFPNLDLPGGQLRQANGADTVTLSFLLETINDGGVIEFEGRTATIQGEVLQLGGHNQAPVGDISLELTDSALFVGDTLDAKLKLNAEGDADLYVAVILPDGNFLTIDSKLNISEANSVIPFMLNTKLENNAEIPIVNLPLGDSVAEGSYKFFVVVTRAGSSVFDDSQWLTLAEASFTFGL